MSGGPSLPVIGALLGHKDVVTTQRYAHLGASPLRQAADDIASRIAAALASQSAARGNAVRAPESRPATVLPSERRA